MHPHWHHTIEENATEHAGIIIDGMQRYLQFDVYAGIIPHDAIDLLFAPVYLHNTARQAIDFFNRYRHILSQMPQKEQEATIRAHLAGIISRPTLNEDLWHNAFRKLHEQHKDHYDGLTISGKVEALLKGHDNIDVITTAVSDFLHHHLPHFTASDLINWTLQAMHYFRDNHHALQQHSVKEQRSMISSYLSGKTG